MCASAAATAQTTLPADLTAKIDAAVTDAVTSTGATFTMPDGKPEQFRVAPE
jgi:hypothetical protein